MDRQFAAAFIYANGNRYTCQILAWQLAAALMNTNDKPYICQLMAW